MLDFQFLARRTGPKRHQIPIILCCERLLAPQVRIPSCKTFNHSLFVAKPLWLRGQLGAWDAPRLWHWRERVPT
jgi:hypothetical protein